MNRVMYVLLTVQPHTILRDKRYFLDLTLTNANVSTISVIANLIEGSKKENIMLPNGTRFHINDALYSSKSTRNLLNFKYIRRNGFHIETMNEGNTICLYITSMIFGKKLITEKLSLKHPFPGPTYLAGSITHPHPLLAAGVPVTPKIHSRYL